MTSSGGTAVLAKLLNTSDAELDADVIMRVARFFAQEVCHSFWFVHAMALRMGSIFPNEDGILKILPSTRDMLEIEAGSTVRARK